jgi:formylglycine-generating enzyme required for sulfatase activity
VKDILISYAPADRAWADWIAWTLEENGYPAQLQPLQTAQQAATTRYQLQLVLLSAQVTTAPPPVQAEDQRIVRVENVLLPASWGLAGAPCLDLVEASEAEATQALLDFVSATRSQGVPIVREGPILQEGPIVRDAPIVMDAPIVTDTPIFTGIPIGQQSQVMRAAPAVGRGGVPSGTLSTEELAVQDEGYTYRNQLKLRRRTAVVQGYTEPLTDNVGLAMVLIPGGTFLMGSPEDEPERFDREGPQHEVTVPQFFMGKYPVTQAEWRFVAGLPQVNRELKPNPSNFEGDRHPVESVSWYEAVEFCDRLSLHTGRTYRLPSEAEWEYACRAGTTTPFHFGETITTDLANYDGTDDPEGHWSGSYDRGPKGEYRQTTTPVDHFDITNSFGLCDMHGNVWEWCLDHYHDSYEDAPEDGSAWIDAEAEENKSRICRGGSWSCDPWYCRSAFRNLGYPRVSDAYIGFRVTCVAPRALR